MTSITSWERIAQKRGEGKGKLDLVLRLLKRKSGELDETITAQIEKLSTARLDKLAEALLDFTQPSDLERWLKTKAR